MSIHPVRAAALPPGFTETKLLAGLNPSAMEIAPDGRVFLCEKNGRVRIFKNGALLPSPFLTLDADYTQERGLLGIALDPAYQASPYVYVYYTAKNPSHNRVSRFRADGDAATGGESVLLELDNLTEVGWHNGGAIHFGKDGKLYIAAGNNTNNVYSQSLSALLGKILRINPDGSIPEDNPFFKTATGSARAIWALGLRNPFTTAVHPITGRIFINDVGEGTFEEIDEGKAGANYGWPKAEGHAATAPGGLIGTYGDPLSAYSHDGACAITGGTFYHPGLNSFGAEYADLYFFADYCGGWIKTLDPANGNAPKSFATGIQRPIDLKAGPDGRLYYLTRGNRAQGVAQGSAEDNTSTGDGALFQVQGPKATRIASGSRPLMIAAGRVLLPAGKRGLALFGMNGVRIWESSGAVSDRPAWLELPKDLPGGVVRARFF